MAVSPLSILPSASLFGCYAEPSHLLMQLYPGEVLMVDYLAAACICVWVNCGMHPAAQ